MNEFINNCKQGDNFGHNNILFKNIMNDNCTVIAEQDCFLLGIENEKFCEVFENYIQYFTSIF